MNFARCLWAYGSTLHGYRYGSESLIPAKNPYPHSRYGFLLGMSTGMMSGTPGFTHADPYSLLVLGHVAAGVEVRVCSSDCISLMRDLVFGREDIVEFLIDVLVLFR